MEFNKLTEPKFEVIRNAKIITNGDLKDYVVDLTITPDDSIIEDKNAEQLKAQQEVAQGLKSKKTYLMNTVDIATIDMEANTQQLTF